MSVFPGAKYININGGIFTAATTSVANAGLQNDIVGLLHSQSATAGLLDAKERFDAPKCDEGTRTSMILGMKKFVQDGDADSSSGLYWLHGPAGVGKSALAQSLSLSLKDEGDHAASFFFSRTSPERNNGNQLIVTLAYQLSVNFPALQPFMTKAVKKNPSITTASNAVQLNGLIIDPINKWRKRYNWSIWRWRDRLNDAKRHPRLILVDGLDECSDPNVQTDLILCIASAVRRLTVPLRFVITSRPESHILATFELNPAFQGLNGVAITRKNLGDDEGADEQITTFLLNEFAEIRRAHPIRDFLPREWPRPDQIGQLVSKSSKGFIYPATVILYIKMPHNRPDECLNRILGLSEIPTSDKPYEPLDLLYRHIFESVPAANKTSIHNIFHCFLLPHIWNGSAYPPNIERHLGYPPGHVQHVLRDLLCLVDLTVDPRGLITVLHASLPDFLLDKSRSGPLFVDVTNVDAIAASSHLLSICSTNEPSSRSSHFSASLGHMMHANMRNTLLCDRILQMSLLPCYRGTLNHSLLAEYLRGLEHQSTYLTLLRVRAKEDIETIASIVAYLLILVIRHGPENHIRDQIAAVKTYVLDKCPAVRNVRLMEEKIIPVTTRLLRDCWASTTYHERIKHIFTREIPPSQIELVEAIFELYCLMMAHCSRQFIGLSSSANKVRHPTGHLAQRVSSGPNFWGNIVKGINNASNIKLLGST